MSKSKWTTEFKEQVVKEYKEGKSSYRDLTKKYGISKDTIREWVLKYDVGGKTSLERKGNNKRYSKEFKQKCVMEYLNGYGSLIDICLKHNISTHEVLRKWIMLYNAGKEQKDYDPKSEVYMPASRRKTTIEERKEIVEYCLSKGRDYKNTAARFDVSYSQVYSWVKKYDELGEDGLIDKRGHHKSDDEVDELERLRRENARLKKKLEENDMVVELLKKVKEFERM